MDKKDRRILTELDKNSRQSLAQIGRNVGCSQEVVYHRVNKLEEAGILKRFQMVASLAKLGYVAPKVYLQLQDADRGDREEIHQYLLDHPNIFWFGICQGGYDLMIAYYVRDALEFGRYMDELLNKFSPYIYERQITFGKNIIQYNRRWLLEEDVELVETDFGNTLQDNDIDETEWELLRYLANNARMQVVDLADRLDVSANTAHYRLQKLEDAGIISGYKIALDVQEIGYETCKSLIYLKNVTEDRRESLIRFIKQHQHVINVVLCVGPWDMEIEFEVESFDQYYTLMEAIRDEFSDIIKNYESALFTDEPKQSFMPGAYPKVEG